MLPLLRVLLSIPGVQASLNTIRRLFRRSLQQLLVRVADEHGRNSESAANTCGQAELFMQKDSAKNCREYRLQRERQCLYGECVRIVFE